MGIHFYGCSTCRGAIYGLYIHDYLQEMMCVADIGLFVHAYERFNK